MDALQLLGALQERGANVFCDGETLRVAPKRVLDDDLRAAIRSQKLELLELLQLETASRESSSTRNTDAPEVAPPLPLSLANIPGIEYSTERGSWLRRIGDAIWIVPMLDAQKQATSSTRIDRDDRDEFAEARAFRAALKQARRDIAPVLRRELTESELNEYSFVVACLDCEIDPRAYALVS